MSMLSITVIMEELRPGSGKQSLSAVVGLVLLILDRFILTKIYSLTQPQVKYSFCTITIFLAF